MPRGRLDFVKPSVRKICAEISEIVHSCTHEHSAIDATHISFETNCLLQLNMAAFSGILYDLVRILRPLPQVTEHDDHGV